MKYIVTLGSLNTGFLCIGPFDSSEDAQQVTKEFRYMNSVVMPVFPYNSESSELAEALAKKMSR